MKETTTLSYSPLLAGALCLLILLVSQFALHPINMAGGMTIPFPLVYLEINIPVVSILYALLLIVIYRSKNEMALLWVLGTAASLMLFIIAYFFVETGVLEARRAKPDLDRFYPQDESHFWYASLVFFCMLGLFYWAKRKTKDKEVK